MVLCTFKRDQLSIASPSYSSIRVAIQPMSQIFSAHSFQTMGISRFMYLRKVSRNQSQSPFFKAILVYQIKTKTLVLTLDKMKPTSTCGMPAHAHFTILFQRRIKNYKAVCSHTWRYIMEL